MKKFTFILLLFISFLGFSQTTQIPDKNFEQALIDKGIDKDKTINGSVLTSAISKVQILLVSDKKIADLTGIEDFTALTILGCFENQLTSLDVSKNIALTNLNCSVNQLTSLDVSKNTALIGLWCFENQLTSLNVKNGNSVNFTFFDAVKNPNLNCIIVDDAYFSTKNWIHRDDTSIFVNDKTICK